MRAASGARCFGGGSARRARDHRGPSRHAGRDLDGPGGDAAAPNTVARSVPRNSARRSGECSISPSTRSPGKPVNRVGGSENVSNAPAPVSGSTWPVGRAEPARGAEWAIFRDGMRNVGTPCGSDTSEVIVSRWRDESATLASLLAPPGGRDLLGRHVQESGGHRRDGRRTAGCGRGPGAGADRQPAGRPR